MFVIVHVFCIEQSAREEANLLGQKYKEVFAFLMGSHFVDRVVFGNGDCFRQN